MTAQPAEEHHGAGHDPDDILTRLPARHHDRFLAEYRAAMVAAAHETWRYRQLQEVLTLWHLRALSYASPGFEQARREAGQGMNSVPAADVIPGWTELVATHGRTA